MSRFALLAWVVVLTLAAGFLFQVKYRVQELEVVLDQAHSEILRNREAIHVLDAEWSYLNRPERIADLASRHLELVPLTPAQIVTLEDLPRRESGDGQVAVAPALPGRERRPTPVNLPVDGLPALPAEHGRNTE